MKKQFYLSLWMCIFALLAACVDDKLETETPQNGGRTVLVYVAADNSLSSFASADLAEMKTGMAKVKDDAGVH